MAAKAQTPSARRAQLERPELAHVPADKVFSEGERTAIALACFLAELRLADDSSGLIFDDPVSSLDHNVREYVARRLVTCEEQAGHRLYARLGIPR